MAFQGIIVTTIQDARALDELIIRIDIRRGWRANDGSFIPLATVRQGPRAGRHVIFDDATAGNTTSSDRRPHPVTANLWAMIVHTGLATHIAAIEAACQTKVNNGTATPLETRIAALPAPVALPSDWFDNGG